MTHCLPYLQFSNSFTSPSTENKHYSGCLSHILSLGWVQVMSLSLTRSSSRERDSSPMSSCAGSGHDLGAPLHKVCLRPVGGVQQFRSVPYICNETNMMRIGQCLGGRENGKYQSGVNLHTSLFDNMGRSYSVRVPR